MEDYVNLFVERNVFDTDAELWIVVRAVPDVALLTPRIDKGDHILRHLDGIRKFIDGELLTADQKKLQLVNKRALFSTLTGS